MKYLWSLSVELAQAVRHSKALSACLNTREGEWLTYVQPDCGPERFPCLSLHGFKVVSGSPVSYNGYLNLWDNRGSEIHIALAESLFEALSRVESIDVQAYMMINETAIFKRALFPISFSEYWSGQR